jgi:hypothetical protein
VKSASTALVVVAAHVAVLGGAMWAFVAVSRHGGSEHTVLPDHVVQAVLGYSFVGFGALALLMSVAGIGFVVVRGVMGWLR